MKESDYQTKIAKDLTAKGWFVLNLIKTNKNGIPDLQASKVGEVTKWIECKTLKGGVISPIQEQRLNQLSKMGFDVSVSIGYKINTWIRTDEKKDTNLF